MLLLFTACSLSPHKPDPSPQTAIEQRAKFKERGTIQVRASVASNEEANDLFGIALHRRGIQAVWLEISNNSPKRARFAPYSLDPDYFPPHEVAYMFRKKFSKDGWKALESYLNSLSMPRDIGPGETKSGYVFTNSTIGTKAFNLDVFYTAERGKNEHFTFFINVPGFTPDHAEVDFQAIYPDGLQDMNLEEFRSYLPIWTCCTRNLDDTKTGRPVTVFIVAQGRDLLQALLRAEWTETSYDKDGNYLLLSEYYFERPPDSLFRKARENVKKESIELAVWLTPISVDGVPVWAIGVRHAIGRLFEIGEHFFGIRFDPDTDTGREFLLQNFWYSRSLEFFAWSNSGRSVDDKEPVSDFNGNVWFSDGFRIVMWLSGEPVSLKKARSRDWDDILAAKAAKAAER